MASANLPGANRPGTGPGATRTASNNTNRRLLAQVPTGNSPSRPATTPNRPSTTPNAAANTPTARNSSTRTALTTTAAAGTTLLASATLANNTLAQNTPATNNSTPQPTANTPSPTLPPNTLRLGQTTQQTVAQVPTTTPQTTSTTPQTTSTTPQPTTTSPTQTTATQTPTTSTQLNHQVAPATPVDPNAPQINRVQNVAVQQIRQDGRREQDLAVQATLSNGQRVNLTLDSTNEAGANANNIKVEEVVSNITETTTKEIPWWQVWNNGFSFRNTTKTETRVVGQDHSVRVTQDLGDREKVVEIARNGTADRVATIDIRQKGDTGLQLSRQINAVNTDGTISTSGLVNAERIQSAIIRKAIASQQPDLEQQLVAMSDQEVINRYGNTLPTITQRQLSNALRSDMSASTLAGKIQNSRTLMAERAQLQGTELNHNSLAQELMFQSTLANPLSGESITLGRTRGLNQNILNGILPTETPLTQVRVVHNSISMDPTGDIMVNVRPVDAQGRATGEITPISLGSLSSINTDPAALGIDVNTPEGKRQAEALNALAQRWQQAEQAYAPILQGMSTLKTDEELQRYIQQNQQQVEERLAQAQQALSNLSPEERSLLGRYLVAVPPEGLTPGSVNVSSLSLQEHLRYGANGKVDFRDQQFRNLQANGQEAPPMGAEAQLRQLAELEQKALSDQRSLQSHIGEGFGGFFRSGWNFVTGKGWTNEWGIDRQRQDAATARTELTNALSAYDQLLQRAGQATTVEDQELLTDQLNAAKTRVDMAREKAASVVENVQNFERQSMETGKMITTELISKGTFLAGTALFAWTGPFAPVIGAGLAGLANVGANYLMNKDTPRGYSWQQAMWDGGAGVIAAVPIPLGPMSKFIKPVIDNPTTRFFFNRATTLFGVRTATRAAENALVKTIGRQGVNRLGNFMSQQLPTEIALNVSNKMAARASEDPSRGTSLTELQNLVLEDSINTVVSAATLGALRVGTTSATRAAGNQINRMRLGTHGLVGDTATHNPLFSRVFNNSLNHTQRDEVFNQLQRRFGTSATNAGDLMRQLTPDQQLKASEFLGDYVHKNGIPLRSRPFFDNLPLLGTRGALERSKIRSHIYDSFGSYDKDGVNLMGLDVGLQSGRRAPGSRYWARRERELGNFSKTLQEQTEALLQQNPNAFSRNVPRQVFEGFHLTAADRSLGIRGSAALGLSDEQMAQRMLGGVYDTLNVNERTALKEILNGYKRANHTEFSFRDLLAAMYQARIQGGVMPMVTPRWSFGRAEMGEFVNRRGVNMVLQGGAVNGLSGDALAVARNYTLNPLMNRFGGYRAGMNTLSQAVNAADLPYAQGLFTSLTGPRRGHFINALTEEMSRHPGRPISRQRLVALARASRATGYEFAPGNIMTGNMDSLKFIGSRLSEIRREMEVLKHVNPATAREWQDLTAQLQRLSREEAALNRAYTIADSLDTPMMVRHTKDGVEATPDWITLMQQRDEDLYRFLNLGLGRRRLTAEDVASIATINARQHGVSGEEIIKRYLDKAFHGHNTAASQAAKAEYIRSVIREQFGLTLRETGNPDHARALAQIDTWINNWTPGPAHKWGPVPMNQVWKFMNNESELEVPFRLRGETFDNLQGRLGGLFGHTPAGVTP